MSKIVLEDFNEGDGYYKVNLTYLSKEQVEEIETLVSKWNHTEEDEKNFIDINIVLFEDKNMSKERHIINWLRSIKQIIEE